MLNEEVLTVNNKSRNGLMLIAGGYLVYLGVRLMRDLINEGAGNSMFFMISAIFFMVAGVLIVIYYARNMIRLNADEAAGIEAAEEEKDNTLESDEEELPEEAAEDETE